MPILTNMWIHTVETSEKSYYQLRFDWSNNRHQAVELVKLDPYRVKRALIDAIQIIEREQYLKNL